MKRLIAWVFGCTILVLRWTCRSRFHNDPRPSLRRRGIRFTYAGMHAQQLGCVMTAERGCGAMVSRSTDGDMITPTLWLCGFEPLRGSSGRADKGGATALQKMIRLVASGTPGAITVDGPRGPRGKAQPGIGLLAKKADAWVVPVHPQIRSRWIFTSSWDRLQLPIPFTRIDVYFGEPIPPDSADSAKEISSLVETSLQALEIRHDPQEARYLHNASASVAATDALGETESSAVARAVA
jgi:lysophospholipid acyltransferase (LPLAT)-like uncharacterized protein